MFAFVNGRWIAFEIDDTQIDDIYISNLSKKCVKHNMVSHHNVIALMLGSNTNVG